jgi:DNA-binding protein HU-beta
LKKIVYLRKINLIIGYMNKSELVDAMASASGLTKTDSKKALDAFISVVSNTLKKGDSVNLTGFASLSVKEKPARTCRNPRTGEQMTTEAKKVVNFKAGAELADVVRYGK